eukprot:CAMPEP_0172820778 /NCGR_PEP_ID=MMETSP1075-20121228/15490_1 /TAXON_ID=2916 /ORGANISM="Ceratium fusus, Strain PA161109" /LENGTH=70 /DNA_ID=CAMNT_0013661501 /DNA_START=551 /DNA_END=760 /DNA_ORIENTATION=-
MERPRAVAVAALERDNGPVDLVEAAFLHEVAAIYGDYTTISITNAALPGAQFLTRCGTRGQSALALAVGH